MADRPNNRIQVVWCDLAALLESQSQLEVPTLATGARLGPYEVLAPIGAGGMGQVYKARDTRLDRPVALKVLLDHLAANPVGRDRFDREARAVAALNHPNICTLYDVGHQDGTDYLVMEFVEGGSAGRAPRQRGPCRSPRRWPSRCQIAEALDTGHTAAASSTGTSSRGTSC